jgi:hypothetical protein
MKKITALLCVLLLAGQVFSQRTPENLKLVKMTPTPHDPNFKSRLKNSEVKSFYKSKADWQHIIDTTWGPGLPLEEKLKIFDSYTDSLTRKFDGFNSLGIDPKEWEAIKSSYRSRIDASTSRGAFSSLMSHFAYSLRDCHTYAMDSVVAFSALNPGTPVLVVNCFDCSHFGAALTTLPDSSLVVLRTLKDHPLGLGPGDIVIGYEGLPWKVLLDELLAFDIPMIGNSSGAKSALRHDVLLSAGNNWHLFDTIDIVKYTSGDTLHLPVYPLLDLPVPVGSDLYSPGEKKNLFLNNEQLPVPGVPFPDPNEINEQAVFYGIVEGTNIGYIYLIIDNSQLSGFDYSTGEQFFKAVTALWNTNGLIIDIRFEIGGWPWPLTAYELLFNEQFYTIEDAYRCSREDFTLCSDNDPDEFKIQGKPMTLYDRPLAVLTGANAGSGGDVRAQWMTYHPMSTFFGMSTAGTMGDHEGIKNFPDWWIYYSKSDVFHVSQPGVYLNRREFPVDDTTWFDRDGVARGEDAVVNKAIEWIRNLSHAHDVTVQPVFTKLVNTEITLTAEVENPNNHMLSVYAKILGKDKVLVDSIPLFDDGGNGDSNAGDGTWGINWPMPSGEKTYAVNLTTADTVAGTIRTLPRVVQFTSVGPVVEDGITFVKPDTVPNPGDKLYFKATLRNNGLSASAVNIMAQLTSLDALAFIPTQGRLFDDIAPGESSTSKSTYKIEISEDCPVNKEILVKADISSDGYTFWSDTFSILVREPVGIENISEPLTRIYPNPTENILNIEINNADNQPLEIEIYTVTGEVIYQKDYKNIAAHFIEQVDLSGYAKGIYLVKVKQDRKVTVGKVVVR